MIEKLYSVEFISYTNCLKDTVSTYIDGMDIKDIEYLKVPSPFLIRESDLDFYKKYGNGYRNLIFVGYLNE